jgi:hypothetical protein
MIRLPGNKVGLPLALTEAPGSGATITVRTLDLRELGQQPYGWLYLGLVSSHDSAASGVTAEASWDEGANWTTIATDSYAAADGFTLFQAPMVAPLIRWRYVNSANVLTTWRGQAFWSQANLVP